jgi:hypothetical protein
MMGNPLMNDAQLSQTAGRSKTRQPGLQVKPTQILLSSYEKDFHRLLCSRIIHLRLTGQPQSIRANAWHGKKGGEFGGQIGSHQIKSCLPGMIRHGQTQAEIQGPKELSYCARTFRADTGMGLFPHENDDS